ncbi:MAG: hypothetical protein KatS3mg080_0792 [Anoxybacillus sp.]|nr:MAG: hypothetical protein KatS3mg080_0792 [Anoxybacillus sp.]
MLPSSHLIYAQYNKEKVPDDASGTSIITQHIVQLQLVLALPHAFSQ